ncbi:LysR family transcriptional regulator [Rhodococcus sp. ACT016]|uniref:LysR family transcriptional regulator n=1 Tax=Rhodococcus sp. ACT016 TaxID=3134808 RepID=UPI003D299246
MDLNLLLSLEALLTERSVTRAAERMSVGQPAMSASLARLRKHFNDPLLVREGRGLALSPLGESLLDPVRTAVGSVEAALERTPVFDPAADRRTFTIIASDYVLVVLLRKLIAVLATEAPGVQLTVAPIGSDFADQLRRKRADLVIVPTEVVDPDFHFPGTHLMTDRYVLIADRNYTDLPEVISIEEFAALPYAAYVVAPIKPVIERQLDTLGIARKIAVGTQSFVAAPFLLRDTRLVSLVHEKLARELEGPAQLRIIEPPVDLPPLHEKLFWHPRHTSDPAHRWLRNRIIELARTLHLKGE